MATSNKKPLLTDAQRTVVFSDKETVAIYDAITCFEPKDLTSSIEEVFQQILNNSSALDADMGSSYFILRQIRDLYNGIYKALKPLHDEYSNLDLDVRHDYENSLKHSL